MKTISNINRKSTGSGSVILKLVLILAVCVLSTQTICASVSHTSNNYSGIDSSRREYKGDPDKQANSVNHTKIVYSVQIISLAGYLPSNAAFFKKCGKAQQHVINKQYVYTIGEYKTAEEAQRKSDELRKKGYNGAFPVAFINDNRVIIDDVNSGLCNK